jgi:Fur family ferric uptake transcriptional regulator
MPGPHKWMHRFQGHVSRWTVPREAILKLLSRTAKHLSAKEIYAALYRIYPGLGLTTVYRNLDLLSNTGFIKKITIGDGQTRYEFKSPEKEEHHHHLICTGCGKIIDYRDFMDEELELIKKTEGSLTRRYNFKITGHNIEFYGLCENCKLTL